MQQQLELTQRGMAVLTISRALVLIFAVLISLTAGAALSNSAHKTIPILTLLLTEETVDPNLPVANAGDNISVLVGELVSLDGSHSSDPDDAALTYLWQFISQPNGSTASLNDPVSATPEFVLDLPGSYEVQLIVNNGDDDSLPDTVIVSNENRAPLADAGENQVVLLNQAATLDASGSSDIDTDPLSFLWSLVQAPVGSIAVLDDAAIDRPTFTPDLAGEYVFDLVVNDGQLDSTAEQIQMLAGLALSLELADTLIGVTRSADATLGLSFPAPQQGISVMLSVDANVVSLQSTSIVFNQGETEKTFSVTGLNAGTTTLVASSTNVESASVEVEVSGALVSIDEVPTLSPTVSRSVAISLSDMAPAGGVTIALESLDSGIATISPSSLTIAEGQFTPSQNAQVTGVNLGTTQIRASAAGYAADEREVEVALAASFSSQTLDVPEQQTRAIVLEIDAPAPTGGVMFDLSIIDPITGQMMVGDAIVTVPATLRIDSGQTQSLPIAVNGVLEGMAILRASSVGFVDADATINVLDAPDIYLRSNGSSSLLAEAIVGVDLQNNFRLNWEQAPPLAVDIRISVPEDSGVLIASDANTVGSQDVLFEDVVNISQPRLYIQGIALGDDVPLTIDVVNANTMIPAGLESITSTIDVDPSGIYVSSNDLNITTFDANRSVSVRSAVLYDEESPGQVGAFRGVQVVRAGQQLIVPVQVANSNVMTLPNGASDIFTLNGNGSTDSIFVAGVAPGATSVAITAQPNGFSLPVGSKDSVTVTVEAPDAYLQSESSSSHLVEAVVGLDLQQRYRIGLQAAPPSPVDIVVSVPPMSGVLLSTDPLSAGSNQIQLNSVTSTRSAPFYIQGTVLGDDVPLTVMVNQAGSATPAGYNSLSSSVDIDPSGIYLNTGDYTTTTFSNSRVIGVTTTLLFDNESPASEGQSYIAQAVRGGLSLSIPMNVDTPSVASLPNGANDTLTIGSGNLSSTILLEPLAAGQVTVSIASLPLAFVEPLNRDSSVVTTITAPAAFLRSLGSASHEGEVTLGFDLQTGQYIGLAETPPAVVDIRVTVPLNSGVLLSDNATAAGDNQLIFTNVSTTRSPLFYLQGTELGDNVAVTIEVFEAGTETPIGYESLLSTVDVDPSGVYLGTGDFTMTTFGANRAVQVRSAVLRDAEDSVHLEGWFLRDQAVRGGQSLTVPMLVADPNVIALPAGASGDLSIIGGQLSGIIEADPLTAGVTTISIASQPNAGFSLPSNRSDEITATVTAPASFFTLTNMSIGDELQTDTRVGLGETPPNPVTVTVESLAPSVALISKDPLTQGSATLTFDNVTSASVGTIYVQGLSLNGATQLRVSAPGYSDGTADVTVVPSGFQLTGSFTNMSVGDSRNLSVRSGRLFNNGAFSGVQAVRGGQSFAIDVTSSDINVGTLASPVTVSAGESSSTVEFSAVAPGTTTIQVLQPVGFSPPVGTSDADITVQ